MTIDLIAKMKDAQSFFDNYQEGDNLKLYAGKSLLFYAMSNNDPEARYTIVSYLLNLGTDALCYNEENETLIHILFSRVRHNISQTVELCTELLRIGVDINYLDKKKRSAIQYLINMKFSDEELRPLYDAIFSSNKIDASSKNAWGFSLLDMAEKVPFRSQLVQLLKAQ